MQTIRTMYRYSDEKVAEACWAVLDVMNDTQGPPWADVPFGPFSALSEEEQKIVVEGVRAARQGATPRELFGLWKTARRDAGWTWGAVKDEALKTHPNLVAYDDLPAAQRDKDKVFQAVVTAMTDVTPALSGPSAFAARRDGDTMRDPLQARHVPASCRRQSWLTPVTVPGGAGREVFLPDESEVCFQQDWRRLREYYRSRRRGTTGTGNYG